MFSLLVGLGAIGIGFLMIKLAMDEANRIKDHKDHVAAMEKEVIELRKWKADHIGKEKA